MTAPVDNTNECLRCCRVFSNSTALATHVCRTEAEREVDNTSAPTCSPWIVRKRPHLFSKRPFYLSRQRTEYGITLPETHRTKSKHWHDCTRTVLFATEAAAQKRADELKAERTP